MVLLSWQQTNEWYRTLKRFFGSRQCSSTPRMLRQVYIRGCTAGCPVCCSGCTAICTAVCTAPDERIEMLKQHMNQNMFSHFGVRGRHAKTFLANLGSFPTLPLVVRTRSTFPAHLCAAFCSTSALEQAIQLAARCCAENNQTNTNRNSSNKNETSMGGTSGLTNFLARKCCTGGCVAESVAPLRSGFRSVPA